MEMMVEMRNLFAMTNGLLFVIAMALIMLGYAMTERQPAIVKQVTGLARIVRREPPDFTVLASGPVQPNGLGYVSNGETHNLPIGWRLPPGRRVGLVMFNG